MSQASSDKGLGPKLRNGKGWFQRSAGKSEKYGLWNINVGLHGLYMGYIWVIYGLYMGYIWVIYGLYLCFISDMLVYCKSSLQFPEKMLVTELMSFPRMQGEGDTLCDKAMV